MWGEQSNNFCAAFYLYFWGEYITAWSMISFTRWRFDAAIINFLSVIVDRQLVCDTCGLQKLFCLKMSDKDGQNHLTCGVHLARAICTPQNHFIPTRTICTGKSPHNHLSVSADRQTDIPTDRHTSGEVVAGSGLVGCNLYKCDLCGASYITPQVTYRLITSQNVQTI